MEKQGDLIDKSHIYTHKFLRNSKSISVLWGVFTLCFAIINVVAFVQPHWIGDTHNSKGTGNFGLWQYCIPSPVDGELECWGQLDELSSILSSSWRASTVLIGLSVVVTFLTIASFLLFFFFTTSTVFHITGSLQLLSALLLTVGTVVYPIGFSSPEVREVCGPTARQYNVGECGVRWAFILAIIGIFDAAVLSALSFVLATRNAKLLTISEQHLEPLYGGSVYKGQMNPEFVTDGASMAGSRKSLNLQPVMLMPQPDQDRFSEFSHHTNRSKTPAYRQHYNSSLHNFQL